MSRRVKLTILVTPQTAYHLRRFAQGGTSGDYGRVVDKLIRDRAMLLKSAMRLEPRKERKDDRE